jgi:hypothetical protein
MKLYEVIETVTYLLLCITYVNVDIFVCVFCDSTVTFEADFLFELKFRENQSFKNLGRVRKLANLSKVTPPFQILKSLNLDFFICLCFYCALLHMYIDIISQLY